MTESKTEPHEGSGMPCPDCTKKMIYRVYVAPEMKKQNGWYCNFCKQQKQ